MKAGIVIEEYKLPFFEKALTDSGYVYENVGRMDRAAGQIVLMVQFEADEFPHLSVLVRETNIKSKQPGSHLQ
jgi:hypothetical protein